MHGFGARLRNQPMQFLRDWLTLRLMHDRRLAAIIITAVATLSACSDGGRTSRPPTDAEIETVIEDHVHQVVGIEFRSIKLSELKREEPRRQFVPEIGAELMTFPVAFAEHVETARGPVDDRPSTTTFYYH